VKSSLSRRSFLIAGLGAGGAALAGWATRPDTILYNGKILTMATREREVEALASTALSSHRTSCDASARRA
jgi:hypothetical protein